MTELLVPSTMAHGPLWPPSRATVLARQEMRVRNYHQPGERGSSRFDIAVWREDGPSQAGGAIACRATRAAQEA